MTLTKAQADVAAWITGILGGYLLRRWGVLQFSHPFFYWNSTGVHIPLTVAQMNHYCHNPFGATLASAATCSSATSAEASKPVYLGAGLLAWALCAVVALKRGSFR